VLLPNRTEEEIRVQMGGMERTKRDKRRGPKLEDLEKLERQEFEKEDKVRVEEIEEDYKRRRRALDDILGLDVVKREVGQEEGEWRKFVKMEGQDVKSSLDLALGLSTESEEQRRKRVLDEALGLI
jgi:hypothetical protein